MVPLTQEKEKQKKERKKERKKRKGIRKGRKKTLHIIEEDGLQFGPLSNFVREACQLVVVKVNFLCLKVRKVLLVLLLLLLLVVAVVVITIMVLA